MTKLLTLSLRESLHTLQRMFISTACISSLILSVTQLVVIGEGCNVISCFAFTVSSLYRLSIYLFILFFKTASYTKV